MRPKVKNHVAIARGDPIQLDFHRNPTNASWAVVVNGGTTPVWQVQHTFDDPRNFTSLSDFKTNATWFDTAGGAGTTANADGNFIVPVTAVSLNVTAGTSLDIDMIVTQSGIRGA